MAVFEGNKNPRIEAIRVFTPEKLGKLNDMLRFVVLTDLVEYDLKPGQVAYNIVTATEQGDPKTVNLKAPLIVDHKSQTIEQVIQQDPDLAVSYPIKDLVKII